MLNVDEFIQKRRNPIADALQLCIFFNRLIVVTCIHRWDFLMTRGCFKCQLVTPTPDINGMNLEVIHNIIKYMVEPGAMCFYLQVWHFL